MKSALREVEAEGGKTGDKLSRNFGKSFQKVGDSIAGVGGKLTKGITVPVAAAAGAVAGLATALGFKRLIGIDTAKAQFEGLGYDAKKVMEQVDVGVNNTSLSMAEGAAAAVGILATGAVPLEGLQDSIKRVANVSAAYNVDAEHAAYLLNTVLTKNKVTWGDLAQMQQNGIPIVSQLADHYGVAGDEIMKMAQDGKISVEELNEVLDKNAGDAAESYAKSWQGITKNIFSNIGKVSAKVLGTSFEVVKEKAAGLLETLRSDDLAAWAENAGEKLGTFLSDTIEKVEKLIGWWKDLSPWMKTAIFSFAGLAVSMGPMLIALGRFISFIGTAIIVVPKIVAALGFLASPITLWVVGIAAVVAALTWFFTKTETGRAIVEKAWAGIQDAMKVVSDWFTATAAPAISKAWDVIKDAGTQVAGWYQQHVAPVFEAFGELVMAVWEYGIKPAFESIKVGWSVVWTQIKSVWDKIGPPLMAFIKGAFEGMKIALGVIWNQIKITVETVLGVIKGIIKTVTALIKGDWAGAWSAIGETFRVIWDGIKRSIGNAMQGLKDSLAATWTTIKNVAAAAWGGIRDSVMGVIDPFVNRIKSAFQSAKDGIGSIWSGIKAATAKPVNFVINTVWNNGLRAALNLIPGVNLGKASPIKGYADGGYTGHGTKYQPAGIVHAGEYVFTKAEVNRLGGPSMLESLKKSLPGYATGGRVHPIGSGIGNTYRGHTGRDFPAGTGTPVRAAGAGTITSTPRLARSYGWHIRQRLDEGLNAIYAHLSRIGVSPGQRVTAGQVIGGVGSTGNSTGPHLHFEINGSDAATVGFLRGSAVSKMGAATGALAGPTAKQKGLWESIKAIPETISGMADKIRNGMTGPWGELMKGGIAGLMGDLKKWVLDKINPFKLPGGYAAGTRSAAPGWSWVGEKGPELMRFRGGEQVMPSDVSRSITAGGGVTARDIAEALMMVGFVAEVRAGVSDGMNNRGSRMFTELLEG